MHTTSELTDATRVFRALADETRLRILRELRERREVCACDFVGCCDVTQPTVSHHLKVLREAGLISSERRGLWIYYCLNEPALSGIKQHLP